MVVLQVCAFDAPNPGNFIAAMTKLEKRLLEEGNQTIYAFSEGAQQYDWCQKIMQRTKVYFLPVEHARIRLKTYQVFSRIFSENRIDIIHSHFELYDIPVTVTAPKNVTIFWHLHDPIKKYYEEAVLSRRLLFHLQYGVIGKRAKLLSVSHEHAAFAHSLGFKKSSIFIVPNGIDEERIQSAFSQDKPDRFLLFGWDVIRKGVDLVVEAAGKMGDLPFEILVIGQEACKEYMETHKEKHVVFADSVSDVNELYRKSKCFLHVSRAEGLSYALLEAIYAGLPVICSDIPENAVGKQFRGVKMVPVGDSDAIRDSMLDLITNGPQLSEADYRINRELISKEYSLTVWTESIMQYYSGCTPAKGMY